jgi:phosphomethylpyrimidine synthase
MAREEGMKPGRMREGIKSGGIVVLRSRAHDAKPLAVGEGTRVKVNANIGTSPDRSDLQTELQKLHAVIAAGADTVMDLSVGPDADEVRRAVLQESSAPVGTVPVYQVALDLRQRRRSFVEARAKDILAGVEKHLADGVDFVTVHCGVTRRNLDVVQRSKRICGIVSRGGSMMAEWMKYSGRENPLYEYYDELLAMARHYRACLSLGDGLRPGALADATDEAQVAELVTLGELVRRARDSGVHVMVEGPGHVPLDQVRENVMLEKSLCDGAPFYLLGPLVTDVACGYDHISGAIGGALAAYYGADFLCYLTPTEHLALPGIEEVREGVVASRIAAHAADIARHHPGAIQWDHRLSRARGRLDWRRVIRDCVYPERARKIFESGRSKTNGVCTMCGEFCAIKKTKETFDDQADG